MRLSFRKQPNPTGLYAVGHPYPDTVIKLNGLWWGTISAPTWQKHHWTIGIKVMDGETSGGWRWVFFKKGFDSENEARVAVTASLSRLFEKYHPHLHEKSEH